MKKRLVSQELIGRYAAKRLPSLAKSFSTLKAIPVRSPEFQSHFSQASVFSSMIEGNTIDLDSYLRYETSGVNVNRKSFVEIQDLIEAYRFALKSALNPRNFLKAHGILSATLLQDPNMRGNLRDRNVYIFGNGRKVYEGAPPALLAGEMKKFFRDLSRLLKKDLTVNEVFYHASMIHLSLAKIHPFADGNGRIARLTEKWFLAKKLGNKAWLIPSEKLYQRRLKSYYRRMDIGRDYENTNWDRAVPFLLLLPMAMTIKN